MALVTSFHCLNILVESFTIFHVHIAQLLSKEIQMCLKHVSDISMTCGIPSCDKLQSFQSQTLEYVALLFPRNPVITAPNALQASCSISSILASKAFEVHIAFTWGSETRSPSRWGTGVKDDGMLGFWRETCHLALVLTVLWYIYAGHDSHDSSELLRLALNHRKLQMALPFVLL